MHPYQLGYDAARVSTSQTESDLTARTDMKIIPCKMEKVNCICVAHAIVYR